MTETLQKKAIAPLLIVAALCPMQPLLAQAMDPVDDLVPPKAVSVRDRPRPEYDPLGLRLGTLSMRPELTLSVSHDDNIYATDGNEVDDLITTLSGGLGVATQVRAFPLSLFGKLGSSSYADNASENFTSWQAGAAVGYNSPQRMQITLTGIAAENVESRAEPSTPALAAEPIEFHTDTVQLQATHTLAFGQLDLDASYESSDFDAARLEDGSLLSQDFRDRDTATVELQGSMRVAGSSSAFLRAAYIERDYTRRLSDGDIDRDSNSKALYAGAAFDITNLMRGEIAVGALRLDNADPSQGSRHSLAVRSNVDIFLSQLVTLTLNATRASAAADIAGSSSYIGTSVGATLDYELRRNLILSAQAQRMDRDYSGIGQSFTTQSAGLSARWLLNRNLQAALAYSFADRDDSEIGRSYEANRITASLRLAL